MHGEKNHDRRMRGREQPRRGVEAGKHRHGDIEDDDIRMQPGGRVDGGHAVGHRGDDLELGREDRPDPFAHLGVIVGDEDARARQRSR